MRTSLILLLGCWLPMAAAAEPTYAERLGWPPGTRVLIPHVDDAGMSHESNLGTIASIDEGVATSFSVMMPCPWVGEIARWIRTDPQHDAGLHLTLTSEWTDYRWPPLAGASVVPGLVDSEGAMWPTVIQVVQHASPDEVETEIRAQIARARGLGFEPTHLDSHMGTLFATREFLERYIKVGIEEGIPVMFPGGHGHFISQQNPAGAEAFRPFGAVIWEAGLPVLDDLHNFSYGWQTLNKTEQYAEAIRTLKPGVTMMIMHSSAHSPTFKHITDSGITRTGDLNAMIDPQLRAVIEEEGVVLSTFRELMARRLAVQEAEQGGD